jgi:hypothetical protein
VLYTLRANRALERRLPVAASPVRVAHSWSGKLELALTRSLSRYATAPVASQSSPRSAAPHRALAIWLLPATIADDEASAVILDRPGRREAAFCHQYDSRTNRKIMRLQVANALGLKIAARSSEVGCSAPQVRQRIVFCASAAQQRQTSLSIYALLRNRHQYVIYRFGWYGTKVNFRLI